MCISANRFCDSNKWSLVKCFLLKCFLFTYLSTFHIRYISLEKLITNQLACTIFILKTDHLGRSIISHRSDFKRQLTDKRFPSIFFRKNIYQFGPQSQNNTAIFVISFSPSVHTRVPTPGKWIHFSSLSLSLIPTSSDRFRCEQGGRLDVESWSTRYLVS